jgi:hypothetical protein
VLVLLLGFEHVGWSNAVDAEFALRKRKLFIEVLSENAYFVFLGHLFETISVELAGFRKVPRFLRFILQVVELQELCKLIVSSVQKHSLLDVVNVVHFQRPHERYLHSETAVCACTFQTYEDAVVY